MILDEHTVVEQSHRRRRFQRSVGMEDGRCPYHIVALPLSRFAGRVDQRRVLFVNTGRLAVHIRSVFPRVENLNFVAVVIGTRRSEEESTVTSRLTFAGDVSWNSPLKMQLIILK